MMPSTSGSILHADDRVIDQFMAVLEAVIAGASYLKSIP
jgi:hypothetical protein